MLRLTTILASTAAISATASLAFAADPPSPREQIGMFTGDTTTNGSATIVTDRTGTHPDGFTGMATVNSLSTAHGPGAPPARHHRHARPDRAGYR